MREGLPAERRDDGLIEGLLELAAGERGRLHVGRAEPPGQLACPRLRHGALPPAPQGLQGRRLVAQVGLRAHQDDRRAQRPQLLGPARARRLKRARLHHRKAQHEHVRVGVAQVSERVQFILYNKLHKSIKHNLRCDVSSCGETLTSQWRKLVHHKLNSINYPNRLNVIQNFIPAKSSGG